MIVTVYLHFLFYFLLFLEYSSTYTSLILSVEMRARICGPQELYVKEDSEVNMRCELSQGPHDLGTIFWYLGTVPVYTDQVSLQSVRQPRVSVHTEWVDGLKSTLHITRAKLTDSGNYTCMPTFGQSATINVHVVNGK